MFKKLFLKSNREKVNNNYIENIPIYKVKSNPYQPRKIFDEEALMGLCQSIENHGLLQPIIVREMPGDYYELVSGERRLKACKIVGMKKIPSIVVIMTDSQSAALAIIENCNREKLHFFEQAEAYYNYLYKNEISQERLAKSLGICQDVIADKIKLLRLSPIVRNIIINKNLSEEYAKLLLNIEDEALQLKVLKRIYENEFTIEKAKELIENAKSINENKKSRDIGIVGICGDYRVFTNTIKQAVNMMNRSGVVIKSYEKEKGDIIEFRIEVMKDS